MSTIAYSVVDAFTATPFKGNGAAVVVLDPNSPLSDIILQQIAAEFNLSETAFVTPIDSSKGRFGLRWFTPKLEVALCGHATLASASVLFSAPTHLPETVKLIGFETRSGSLTAQALPDGRIELEFPAGETTAVDLEVGIGETAREVVQDAFKPREYTEVIYVGIGAGVSFQKYMVIEIEGFDLEKATVKPEHFVRLAPGHRVLILTQRGRKEDETFVSRVFAPASGIPEDPVTGSAHCMLGPYWAKKLQIEGEVEMVGKQVSLRSGEVGVVWHREKGICKLRGHAKLVAKGEFYLPE